MFECIDITQRRNSKFARGSKKISGDLEKELESMASSRRLVS